MRHRNGRWLPLDYTGRCDTVLLRREMRWTITAALAGGAAGYLAAGAEAALIGAGIGFLVQQVSYQVTVRELWRGWRNHAAANRELREYGGEPVTAEEMEALFQHRSCARAFTLWMRLAGWKDRLYIALWRYPKDVDIVESIETPREDPVRAYHIKADTRITLAYAQAVRLGDEPRWCDTAARRRLRRTLQRDEERLLAIASEETGSDT